MVRLSRADRSVGSAISPPPRRLIARPVAVLACLGLAFGASVTFTSGAAWAKGITISKASWSKRSLNTTLYSKKKGPGKVSNFRVNVSSSRPLTSVRAVAVSTNKKSDTKFIFLERKSGTAKKGLWVGEAWFGKDDRGTWRVTEVNVFDDKWDSGGSTDQQGGAPSAQFKDSKGIGGTVKVTSAPNAKPKKVSRTTQAAAGQAVTLKAQYVVNRKPVTKGKVVFTVYYYAMDGHRVNKEYTVKINKKGIATQNIVMPECWL
ncbi:MAG: hypothetical protein FWD59_04505, partial [Micrococcales bacterium]|nr:hypothetical protein [Micrococcales bacterium]